MSAVTYSNQEIQKLLPELFVSVKIEARTDSKNSQFFDVQATPTFVATDGDRKIHYKVSGFHAPEAFKQRLRLMRAIVDLNNRRYDDAVGLLSSVVQETFENDITPEALYQLGVARYKKSGDFTDAVQEWRKIQIQFPESPWLKKVEYAL
jgi:outer membrane protein assembly factor BamD (BamD/ComL family)